ncbi:MAG TPA: hypothetical protein VLD37_04060 [Candidatus Bilamarchaeum sp.]|nr:hypothetical protein [Candidatus Bilamarchaeum sp.]
MRTGILSRLACARNFAEQAGLYETSCRLEEIRKEMSRFHELPRERQAYRAAWALGRAEEAKNAMERELSPGMERTVKDRRADKDSGAILAKIGLCICTMFGGMLALMANESHRILTGAAFVIGTVAAAFTIDSMIGSKEPQETAEQVRKTLDELRRALTCRMLGR